MVFSVFKAFMYFIFTYLLPWEFFYNINLSTFQKIFMPGWLVTKRDIIYLSPRIQSWFKISPNLVFKLYIHPINYIEFAVLGISLFQNQALCGKNYQYVAINRLKPHVGLNSWILFQQNCFYIYLNICGCVCPSVCLSVCLSVQQGTLWC